MELNEVLVKNIKKIRIEKKLSQEKLSEISGLDLKYINKLENGRFNLTIPTLERILNGLDIDYILFFETLERKENSSVNRLINTVNELEVRKRDVVIDKIQELIQEIKD
jgi:transcriptional regulator with XRE-family HTH domain